MYLSGETIRSSGLVTIDPLCTRSTFNGMSYGLGPAGYDVRVREPIDLGPGDFVLASVYEWLKLGDTIIGFVKDKSTLARMGIALQNTVIEPGWEGHLTLEISNHGRDRVRIPPMSPIAQILFAQTDGPCEMYSGKYQGQGPQPQGALFER